MMKAKGKFRKIGGILYDKELRQSIKDLPDNENYLFFFCDDRKNRNLPSLSYLFSVVLKYISDNLPDHPTTESLYKYFEDMFAPVHTCSINGEVFKYTDAKREKQSDFNDFIERIIDYSWREWKIDVPDNDELRDPEHREFYVQAYAQQEIDWNRFISSRNNRNKDE